MSNIEDKLQSLEQKLRAENEWAQYPHPISSQQQPNPATSNAQAPAFVEPRSGSGRRIPTMDMGKLTPNRPRKKLDLPGLFPQPQRSNETDMKLNEIMQRNGILKINGQSFQTDIKDLEEMGELGSGTSGQVIKMRHTPTGTIIAVKQMRRTGNVEEDKRIIMDLDVVLKSHDCPYIVQCLGCFITKADVWICMELMATCFDRLQKKSKQPVPENILGKVTVATVKALNYLKKQHDVIHRDIKPSNILIDEKGNIKLCDFGISGRLVDSKAKTRAAGCAAYMAPERIDPTKKKYDIRADVWSLGITLVELATGTFPYANCNTDFEVLAKVLQSDPPCLPNNKDFSPNFQDFVRKCLTKDFNDRPKYPELLNQEFIKLNDDKDIDVAKWLAVTMDQTGLKSHRRLSPMQPLNPMQHVSQRQIQKLPITTPNHQLSSNQQQQQQPHVTNNIKVASSNHQHLKQQMNHPEYRPVSGGNQSKVHPMPSSIPQLLQHNNHHSLHYHQQQVQQPPGDPPPIRNGYKETQRYPQQAGHQSENTPKNVPSGYGSSQNNDIVQQMNQMYKRSPFTQRRLGEYKTLERTIASEQPPQTHHGSTLVRNINSPFGQTKTQRGEQQDYEEYMSGVGSGGPLDGGNGGGETMSPTLYGRKRFQTALPTVSRLHGNTSPIVLQRFYHQQSQLRENEEEKMLNRCETPPPYVSQISSGSSSSASPAPLNNATNPFISSIPVYNTTQQLYQSAATKTPPLSPKTIADQQKFLFNKQQHHHNTTQSPHHNHRKSLTAHPALVSNGSGHSGAEQSVDTKDDPGWFNSFTGMFKRRFASYVKLHLVDKSKEPNQSGTGSSQSNTSGKNCRHRTRSTNPFIVNSGSNDINHQFLSSSPQYSCSQPTSPHFLRHRSPDPPPRYNRGQSPLLLRRNLLELSDSTAVSSSTTNNAPPHSSSSPPMHIQPNSPLFTRRITASPSPTPPPLPPPRRGSESVPGSPQHFRTRIHYTPEPQRRPAILYHHHPNINVQQQQQQQPQPSLFQRSQYQSQLQQPSSLPPQSSMLDQ